MKQEGWNLTEVCRKENHMISVLQDLGILAFEHTFIHRKDTKAIPMETLLLRSPGTHRTE